MEPLRGAPGSKIVLTIVREGTPKPFDVTLVRDTIRVTSVRGRLLEPGYGYVRISAFQTDTAADFQKQLERLQEGGALRGLVLDLRRDGASRAFTTRDDLAALATRGVATPDHVIRTKGHPLLVTQAMLDAGPDALRAAVAGFGPVRLDVTTPPRPPSPRRCAS